MVLLKKIQLPSTNIIYKYGCFTLRCCRDEHTQVADIFLKKGPYLKMYSTYIREYDKNVALLEEQCKRNPAFNAVVRDFEVMRLD